MADALFPHAALADLLKLHATHAFHIPTPDIPITEFLAWSFPQESPAFVFSKPEVWFSADAPTTDVACLLHRSIPSQEFLAKLTNKVGQAWFDSSRSIVDPRFNDGRDRLQLWALTFWKAMARVAQDQIMWRRSRDWMQRELAKKNISDDDCQALTTTSSLLDVLGWDTKIHGAWTNFNLATILSWDWLSDDHIDMMMADLSARVEADPHLAAKVIIAPLAFSQAVKNGAKKKTYTKGDTPLLAQYEEHIKNFGLAEMYFPVHINDNHWIAAVVDFERRLIGTGEYLQGDSRVGMSAPPLKFIKDLKRWLKMQFGGKDFTYQGDSLEHGDQRDTSSCSIVTRSMIAGGVFGEALWEQKHAATAQATCFIRLVRSAAIRKMSNPVPKQSKITSATLPEISIAVAIGDHNFPDLEAFALDVNTPAVVRQSRPTLAELLNPMPLTTPGTTPPEPQDVQMPDAPREQTYAGDHGDIGRDDDACSVEGDADDEEAPMAVD
ncbi:hypothetical protein B0H10DRAFT_2235205, partial [Mycena sp. CBHHK59/15]